MIRVALLVEDGYLQRFSYLDACRAELLDRGLDCARGLPDPDITIVQNTILHGDPALLAETVRPLIVYERIDAAALTTRAGPRRLLARPNVKAWFKETAYRDKALYNAMHANGRRHLLTLKETAPEGAYPELVAAMPDLPLDAAQMAKVETWPPVHLQAKIVAARAIRPRRWDQRRKDIAFAGTVDYGFQVISRHRMRACERMMALPGANRIIGLGRVFRPADYYELLADTRLFVSPYGYGEYSFKDFEAAYAGAAVVRPPSGHVQTALYDIYEPGRYVIETDPWMEDLPRAYEAVMDNQAEHAARAEAARDDLFATHDPAGVADAFAALIRAALAR